MTELLKGVYAVGIPDSAYDITIRQNGQMQGYKKTGAIYWDRDLPPGKWTILFSTKEATEEQWKSIIGYDELANCYYDYIDMGSGYHDAIKSGHSLLRSRNLDPANNYAIIKLNT
jgi:hypothetical protein